MPNEQFTREDLGVAPTGGEAVLYHDPEEAPILAALEERTDFEAMRLKRLMALPDLTRKENSPVKFLVDALLTIPAFRGFDVAQIPETITVRKAFDLFDFPENHPSRRETDTYFVGLERILRTHTTSMWLYYLHDPKTLQKLEEEGSVGLLAYGKVYRKDEIDRKHFPVFHQIDGLFLQKREKKTITLQDLQDVLAQVVRAAFGDAIEWRFLDDAFPFTDPSTQVEVKFNNDWLEVVGAGLVRGSVLQKLGVDPKIYNGWAFGFGVDRLAMMKMGIPDIRVLWSDDPRITKQFTSIDSTYSEVSKYPSIVRDISFVVPKEVVPNRFYEIVREVGGNLVEEVKLIDEYENEAKLGVGKKSYTFRTTYRSFERTLTNEEVNDIHHRVEELVREELGAVVR